MSRQQFGGDAAAWMVTPVDASALLGPGKTVVGFASGDVDITFYDSPNGTPLTDLLDANGSPITAVTVSAGQPYIPFFSGPDGSVVLWFADVFGAWHVLLPSDSAVRIAGLEDRVTDLESTGVGGGGSLDLSSLSVLFIDEVVGGYPARPDNIPVPRFWRGPDRPPVGTVAGSLYMMDGDMWLHSSALIVSS